MRTQVHAEMLVNSSLQHHQYTAELIPFYFFRVRANGLLADKDYRPKWKSFEIPKCDRAMFEPFDRRRDALDAQAAAGDETQEDRQVYEEAADTKAQAGARVGAERRSAAVQDAGSDKSRRTQPAQQGARAPTRKAATAEGTGAQAKRAPVPRRKSAGSL